MILQNEEKTRTIFMCNANDGHCDCGSFELYWSDFGKGCIDDIDYWFAVKHYPTGLWHTLKDWWHQKDRHWADISLGRRDLEGLRDAIIKELAEADKSVDKSHLTSNE